MNFRDDVLALAAKRRDELLGEIDAIHREMEEIDAFAELVKDWKTRRDWKLKPEPEKHGQGDLMRSVLARLDADEPKTVRQVADEMTTQPQNIQSALTRLVKAGRVRRIESSGKRGNRHHPATYVKLVVVEEVKREATVWP